MLLLLYYLINGLIDPEKLVVFNGATADLEETSKTLSSTKLQTGYKDFKMFPLT